MKKVLIALLIGVVGLAIASQAQLAIGVDGGVADANSIALRYDFTEAIVGKLGLNYNNVSVGGASTSTTGYGLQIAYLFPVKLAAATPLVGITYNSDGASTATNTIALILGAEAEVADGVKFSSGITLYGSADTGGAATTTMSTGNVWWGIYCDIM